MWIEKLTINNYRVFRNLDLTFGKNSVILFGINGVGKSTILSAISYVFRIFLKQINPAQTKAFERFDDDMVSIGYDNIKIMADVALKDHFLLARFYKKSVKNIRASEVTYPKINYSEFKNSFTSQYLLNDEIGMPIFVHYGTNRAVLDIPDRIRTKHRFDKLSAIERAVDQRLDFRTFFEWFRERESDEVLRIRETADYEYADRALVCVRRAIETMIGDVSGLQIKRNPVRMVVYKADREIRVDLLSDGEKCTLALLGDLARRLVLANPSADNPLEGQGIVLIDEIELHMHPSWQRRILHVLKEVFPNIQFVITTHSPQVLGEANDEYKVFPLNLDSKGNGIVSSTIPRMDGFDSNYILEEYMDTSSESKTKQDLVRAVNEAIRKHNYSLAERMLEELRNLSGDVDEDYILANGYLMRVKNGIH